MAEPAGLTRPSLRRRVRRAFVLAIVVATLGSLLGVVAFGNLLTARRAVVERFDPAALAAERFRGGLVDQETAVRAYVLTGDRTYLEPLASGRDRQDQARRELATLVGRSVVADELDAAQAAADRWSRAYASPTIEAVDGGGPAAARAAEPGSLASGKRLFDEFRTAVDELQRSLALERAAARRDLQRATQLLVGVLIAVAAILVAVVGGLHGLIRRQVEEPLGQLRRDTQAVAGGAFDRPVRPTGLAELYETGQAVEAMRVRIVDELDVSDTARRALDERATELARSNAELEQFAYVASHDLQEPLRKVTAFSQLLQQRYAGQLDDRADQYIEFAVDGAKRMQVLINDLLAFSRVGRSGVTAVAVDADDLVDTAERNLAALLTDADARVERTPLPSVLVAPALGTAVFQNLIGNAVKFRRPDEPPRVAISAFTQDGWVHVAVTDNGIGIEPAYAERVFTIFQRLHTKEAYPGTGIGLALCRKIVEQHGGRIWIDTELGHEQGTTVRFTLPAAATDEATR